MSMFELTNFNRALEGMRERLFLLEEFPYIDRNRLPRGVVERSQGKNLKEFSCSLLGKEMESLLFEIMHQESEEMRERAADIICMRFSPRIIKLSFSLYQSYFDTTPMRLLRDKLVSEAERRGEFPHEGNFFWDFDENKDDPEVLKEEFTARWRMLDDFFKEYGMRSESRLAMEIRLRYLEDADINIIHSNLRHFLVLLEGKQEKELVKTITNYILQADIAHAVDEIFVSILEKLGEPALSKKWKGYDEAVIDKFSQWSFYHRLQLHSAEYPKKYEILSAYYKQVKESYELEDSAFVIDYGDIVVVDLPHDPYSYFIYKWEFNRQMKEWDEMEVLPVFYEKALDQVTARDYIIEDVDAPYILLQYEGVGLLYIKEILGIKLGLIPDLKSIGRKLREDAKFNIGKS